MACTCLGGVTKNNPIHAGFFPIRRSREGRLSEMSKSKPSSLPPDTMIGGYRIVRRISSGGFGVVYLATDAQGQDFAIKEYLPSSLTTREPGELVPKVATEKLTLYRLGLKSFFEEGRSLAQIAHPSVVSVMNFFRENETVYMVMNHLEGSTLQDFIIIARDLKKQKIFRESTIRSLFDEILRGLRVVHQHKMLHLDIKPANIFITNDNRSILIDFGAAREVLNKEGSFIRPMYTPGFAAPEMYRRDGKMGAVDRYLRDRRLHLLLHAGLPAQRCAAAAGEGPAFAVAVAPARHLFGRPHQRCRMEHGAGPAGAAAVGVFLAEGTGPRGGPQVHQDQCRREDAHAV